MIEPTSLPSAVAASFESAMVVEMQYRAGIAWIKFIGTHAQYDKIDVETVNEN